jgi:CrcB protein
MQLFWVGIGGFLGAISRHGVGRAAGTWGQAAAIPLGTTLVNLAGCLAIGVVMALAESRGGPSEGTRAFVVIGFLGGFTTFSAFGHETIDALQRGHPAMAAVNVGLQVLGGLACVVAGRALAGWLA